jgi:hypothetical protein
MLLRASECVQHCIVAAVANGIAQSGRAGVIVDNIQKCATFSSQPSAPSSGPENAVVSMLHACDGKPPLVVAQAVVGVPE